MTIYDIAVDYHRKGINLLPVKHDGSKAPAVEGLDAEHSWKYLQTRWATESELRVFFSNGNGIAAIAGKVSGNLEDIDFDHLPSFDAWKEMVIDQLGPEFFDSLLIVHTPRPGRAVIYRCPGGVEGSQKLAMAPNPNYGKPDEPKFITLIETKSEGGYFLLPGCPPDCHETGRTYDVRQGSFDAIPELTAEQRDVLLTCARSLDQQPRPIFEVPRTPRAETTDVLPGEDFNRRGPSIESILENAGWRRWRTFQDKTWWTRPGKSKGVSASTNGEFFYAWTTNSDFDDKRAYGKFPVYAILNFAGDFHAAAKFLYSEGYGTQHESKEERQRREDAEIRAAMEEAPEEEPRESFVDFAPSFLAIEDPPLEYIIPALTPRGALNLSHGDPRTMKSLAALEEAVAAATATPAFGMESFRPARKYRVLFCSQEDAASIVRPRVKKLLRARGIDTFPEALGFAVYKGIDLDSLEWRERFYDEIIRQDFDLITIDPARGFTAFADAGPKDVLPVAKFLRRFTSRGKAVRLVHHDTKPPASGQDSRKRSHRASGGAWFSVSEAIVSFEKLGERQSLVRPEDYKFSADPKPFTIEYRETDDGLSLVGEGSTAEDAATLAIDQEVLKYLASRPGASGYSITKALKKGAGTITESLDRLFMADKIDCIEGPRRSKLWSIR